MQEDGGVEGHLQHGPHQDDARHAELLTTQYWLPKSLNDLTDLEAVDDEPIEGEEGARPERQGGSQQVSPLGVIVRCGNLIITIICCSCLTVVFGGHFVDITFYFIYTCWFIDYILILY